MPLAHQLGYQRDTAVAPADLIRWPEGAITVECLVGAIRTILRSLVYRWQGNAWVVQGSRLHDRSSLRLALRLLWQWCHSKQGIVTATQLDIHDDLLRFLVRKEAGKLFGEGDERTKALAQQAVQLTLDLVLGDAVPLEPQA
jgi:malate synthase